MKREAEESDDSQQDAERKARTAPSDDDDLDAPVSAASRRTVSVKKGSECPYLDTVSRQVRPAPACRPCRLCACGK